MDNLTRPEVVRTSNLETVNEPGTESPETASNATAAPPVSHITQARRAPLVDLVEHWSGDSARAVPTKLQPVRLDANSRLIIPFTTNTVPVDLHYLDPQSVRAYVHCTGEGCLLCALGKSPDHRQLLPVFDPIAGTVVVLPISPNVRPGALWPQLLPHLTRVKRGERLILDIRSPARGEYVVNGHPLPDSGSDGAGIIARFAAEYEAGRVDPSEVYPRMTREVLLTVPELARQAQYLGITS